MGKKKMNTSSGELLELRHEPVPGYRKALAVVIVVAALYLAMIFIW